MIKSPTTVPIGCVSLTVLLERPRSVGVSLTLLMVMVKSLVKVAPRLSVVLIVMLWLELASKLIRF